ncbi:fibronectin type III domain-containing protein [Bacteriovoracaceae bacterium]|nr:fibronectin type III domain-containing protein [Bacteriovoracaceae bacterium]
MMKLKLTFTLFLFILISSVFQGCVGTVESNKEKKVKSPVEANDTINYEGITYLRSISEQALEVGFAAMPASVSEAIFEIHLNNSPSPINVVASDLEERSDGDNVFTIYKLAPSTTYSVKVNLFDKGRKKRIKSKNTLIAKTFTQRVAEFKGIKTVTNYLGADSMTKLRLSYEPAYNDSHINKKDYHNKRYIIKMTWGDSASRDILDFGNATNKATLYQEHYSGTTPNDTYDAVGLIPGTEYCFMMNAESRERYYKEPDETVPIESNTRYACGKTEATVGLMEWDETSVVFNLGAGADARETIQAKWDSASGGFAGYLFLIAGVEIGTAIPITPGSPNQFTDTNLDSLIPGNITHVKQVENDFGAWDPNLINFSITGLNNYSYYQVMIVVCRNATCQDSDRIESPMQLIRTVPSLPTNGGVNYIGDPDDKLATNKGTVHFDPIDTNSGYADYLHLYCYSDESGSDPIQLDVGTEVIDPTHPCHGIIRQTSDPTSYSDFDTFTEIEFIDTQGLNGNRYCFSLIPQITDAAYTTVVSAYPAKIVCKTIRLLTPTLEQFPGLTSNCSGSNISEDNFKVTWNDPTGGLYTGYEAYLVNKVDQNFSYTNAVAGHGDYTVEAAIADGVNDFTFQDLTPGQTYQVGILAYLNDGVGGKVYSEFNNGTVECQISYPEATFEKFEDIFAVGPKTNGLHPEHYLDSISGGDERKRKKALLETMDPITTMPAEVEMDPDGVTPLAAGAHSSANGINEFDGIYGRLDNDGGNPIHAYSNNGIVRLVWEDFPLNIATKADAANCESERADLKMNLQEAACIYGVKATEETDKNNRRFGYKVYRSVNNKSTWKELTTYDGTTNQTVNNAGLIRAQEYYHWGWNSSPGVARAMERSKIFAASFIDYSALYEPEDISGGAQIERGKILHYKLVPVFDGQEIEFEDDSNKNVVRVILPPANMAFVHRKIANKTLCDQMALPISTNPTLHYSCAYNGLGARPILDHARGEGRYDIGSDLLVDRYEIGCDFTRGSLSEAESTIHNNFLTDSFDRRSEEFEGTSQSGNFIGCNGQEHNDTLLAWDSNGTTEYDYMLKGDCVGQGNVSGIANTTCADPANTGQLRSFVAPGLTGTKACNDPAKGLDNPHTMDEFVIEYFMQPAQPHAVHTYRDNGGSSWSIPNIPGRNDTNISLGSTGGQMRCAINLPYVHDFGEGNRFVPRWFSLNQILTNVGGSLWHDKTLRDIYDDRTVWYDDVGDPVAHEVASPLDTSAVDIISGENRYNYYLDRPIARVMTSNEAHLPPLNNLNQSLAQRICETYEVEIGSENGGGAFVALSGSRQSKQLPSRKLMIAMSQWPDTFRPPFNVANPANRGHIENIESGRTLGGTIHAGEVAHPENMSCNVADKVYGGYSWDSGDELNSNLGSSSNNELTTGSSVQRSIAGRSTEACISRFGVQDFVGNVTEMAVDRIGCDMSGEEILYGPLAGPTRYNDSVLLVGDSSSNTEYFSRDPLHLANSTWVQSNPNTGECSAYTNGMDDNYPFVQGGDINPVTLFDGSLNTDLIDITYTPYDPEAVQDLRDGFGTIFQTGQNGFSPPISQNNTMSLEIASNKYFAPGVGLSLNTNIENDFEYAEGNVSPVQMWFQVGIDKFFDSAYPEPATPLNEDDFWIPYFPVGMSELTSIGMSEITDQDVSYDPTQANPQNYNFYTSVTLGTPNSPTNNTPDTTDTATWGAAIPLRRTYWQLDRNINTTFYSGGNHSEDKPGRYTATLRAANSRTAGSRCMVRIDSE